jgi:hypothetical protein
LDNDHLKAFEYAGVTLNSTYYNDIFTGYYADKIVVGSGEDIKLDHKHILRIKNCGVEIARARNF